MGIEQVMSELPNHEVFTKISLVDKGWSTDKKYYIETQSGKQLLLRISAMDQYEKKKSEFEIMQLVDALGISTSRPLYFGVCKNEQVDYMLLSWCNGTDLELLLPTMTVKEQYQLGVKSGEMLKRLHEIPAPCDIPDWAMRFNRKIDWKIEQYHACGIRFEGDEHFITYIQNNRALLDNRPQSYQHGDYHIGNMILSPEGKLFVIDFNRYDYGDPWEEFNRIVWSAEASPHFSTGQLNGYFGSTPPIEFFRLLMLYIANNTLASIPWAMPFGQKDVEKMLEQSQDVLRWYDYMKNPIPTWYLREYTLP